MNIKQTKRYFKELINSKQHESIMLWGGPGIGKSQGIKQVAKELKADLIDLRLSLLNPVDLRGLPFIDKEKQEASWLKPTFLPKTNKLTILFLDEINLAPLSVQSAAYQLILDRKIGEYEVPDNTYIIAAGNRMEDRAHVTEFPAPLANRFIHINVDPDYDSWRDWAIREEINEKIISFLSNDPEYLYKKPKKGVKAFPTPRSWEFASKNLRIDKNIRKEVLNGIVGEEAVNQFYAWIRIYKELPDIDKILNGSMVNKKGFFNKVEVPDRNDIISTLTISLGIRSKEDNFDNVVKYIDYLPKEYQLLYINVVLNGQHEDKFRLSEAWKAWDAKNKDLMNEL